MKPTFLFHLHLRLRNRNAGFTLAEIMIATALTMMMVVLLLSLTQGLLGSFTSARDRMLRQGDISFALDQMVQDLEGLVVPNATDSEGLRMTSETVGNADGVWLTFLSTATDLDNSTTNDNISHQGATRAISYRLAHQNPIDGSDDQPAYAIYRSIASAKHTFENALNVDDLQGDYWSSLPATPDPTPRDPTDIGSFLSGNVVEFTVRFLRADNDTWTQPDDNVRIASDGVYVGSDQVEGGFTRAEVSVTVLSEEGATRLESGLDPAEVKKRYGKTSVRQTRELNML